MDTGSDFRVATLAKRIPITLKRVDAIRERLEMHKEALGMDYDALDSMLRVAYTHAYGNDFLFRITRRLNRMENDEKE